MVIVVRCFFVQLFNPIFQHISLSFIFKHLPEDGLFLKMLQGGGLSAGPSAKFELHDSFWLHI